MLTLLTHKAVDKYNPNKRSCVILKQERIALFLLCGVGITVFCASIIMEGIGKEPFTEGYSDQSNEGTLVAYEGRVDDIATTKTGGHLTMNVSGVKVFVPAAAAQGLKIFKGDRIRIYGTVQKYLGEREILVSSAGDIRIIPLE